MQDNQWDGRDKYKLETKAKRNTRRATQVVTTACVAIEPLFSWFLGKTAYEALLNILQRVEESSDYQFNAEEKILVTAAVGLLAAANLIGDVGSVDPAGDAQAFVGMFNVAKIKAMSKPNLIATTTLTLGFIATSYWVGAAADAVPLAQPIDNLFGIGIAGQVANYSALGMLGFLGTVYYIMFGTRNLSNHLDNMGEIAKHPLEFASRLGRHLPQYLEVLLQSFSNISYRSISFGAIILQSLAQNLKITDLETQKRLFYMTLIGTGFVALLTRTKQIADGFVKPEYDTLKWGEWIHGLGKSLKTPSGIANFTMSTLLSAIRGGAPVVIGLELFDEMYKPYIYATGMFLGLHKLSVELSAQANKAALAALSPQELAARLGTEIEDALLQQETNEQIAERLFQEMKKTYYKGIVNTLVFADNTLARICRLLGFVGFVYMCAGFLKIDLSLEMSMALSLLWGSGVFNADAHTFQNVMMDFFSSFMVRIFIEKYAAQQQTDQLGSNHETNSLIDSNSPWQANYGATDVEDTESNDGVNKGRGELIPRGTANKAAKIGFLGTLSTLGRAYVTADSRYQDELVIDAAKLHPGMRQRSAI